MSRMRRAPLPADASPPHRHRIAQLERSCEQTEAVLRQSAELMVGAKIMLQEADRTLEQAWVLRDRPVGSRWRD